jgi:folate-binding protein YgfZ
MPNDWRALELDRWGVVHVSGADVVRFLQGQLSNDVTLLTPEHSLVAGLHNPQGRVIAILRLLYVQSDAVLMLLPRELVTLVLERLRRFVLRAKVRLTDATSEWRVLGLIGGNDTAPAGLKLPRSAGAQLHDESQLSVCVAEMPPRWIVLAPAASPALPGFAIAQSSEWMRLDVAAGIPQVYAQTSELFVAQMLNLDVVDGISFDKGCYTGQEVIARAHYRGRVKRRMQRFRTSEPAALTPGEAGQLADGRSVRIVEAAALEDGRCDFLAVAPVSAEGESAREADAKTLIAEPMPLPYALPA